MSAERILMDAFKLNLYEARVYLSLLRGPLSVKDSARAASVPLPRVYDIVSSLELKGFVERKGALVSAIQPRAALEGRSSQFETAFQKQREERLTSLDELLSILEPSFSSTPQQQDEVTVLKGINAIASKFIELAAEGDVILVIRRALEAKELFLRYMEERREKAGRFRILISDEVRLKKDEERTISSLGLNVRRAKNLFIDAMIAGGDAVMIGVPDPLSREPFHSIAVLVRSSAFNSSVRESLESVWERARGSGSARAP